MEEQKRNPAQGLSESEQVQVRRQKLADLQAAGNDPFTLTKFPQDAYSADLKEEFKDLPNETDSGKQVALAGRMMSKRVMGKASFAHLRDDKGDIQLYVRRDELGEEAYAAFKKLDVGDIIGVKGEVFRTKTGELSVRATELTLLAKSLRPLPEKFHGLTDTEMRYRQRYVDLIANPEVKDTFVKRTSMVEAMLETGVAIPSMCLSAHRRFPFGSRDENVRLRAREIMTKAIRLARDLGIRTIQLAGYDVYYETHDDGTQQRFAEGLAWAVEQAAAAQVMLAVEIMDTAFMNSISKWKKWDEMLASPWFSVYPDVGNLSAWGNDVAAELALGINRIAAIHLKDTQPVTAHSPGQFRDVPFGEGCVDFVDVFSTLQQLNYRGAFLIEMWTEKASEPVLEIIQARRWIEARMQEGGLTC